MFTDNDFSILGNQQTNESVDEQAQPVKRRGRPRTTHLTERQKRMLDYIKHFVDENGFPPTVREIGDGSGVSSTSTVHANLKRMTELGYIKYTPGTRRAITLCEKSAAGLNSPAVPVPVVGDVAAGTPILAVDNIQEYYKLPTSMLHGARENEAFILTIRGDSMKEIGMLDGDLIVVNSSVSVTNGDIAVARVAGETATVKRFFKENNGTIRLQPENSTMDPIIVPAEEVEIVGKVIALLRQY